MAEKEVQITVLETGPLFVNTYIIRNGGKAFLIDPGGNLEQILEGIGDAQLDAVLLTHSHYDHFGALNELLEASEGSRYLCHGTCALRASNARDNLCMLITDSPYSAVRPSAELVDGEDFKAAGLDVRAMHVPGHSPGHLCFYLPDEGVLFSGDTVFAGGLGRSDLPGGDEALLKSKVLELLNSIPEETVIYPGHGPSTTAGRELSEYPCL